MRINHNIMAMNTHRQYAINNDNLARATEKMSSGYRINSAADDAAGLAISEKMRAQIRGLNMASQNSEDAISLVQTAEGALEETGSILQRMRELAVQSASDTNEETVDRAALDAEYQQLMEELDDIATKTAFNKRTLLDGSVGTTITAAYGGASTAAAADKTAITAGLTFAVDSDDTALEAGTYDTFAYVAAVAEGSPGDGDATAAAITFQDEGGNTYTVAAGPDGGATGATFAAGTYNILNDSSEVVGTITLTADAAAAVDNANAFNAFSVDLELNAMTFQTGANQNDTLTIQIGNMSSEGLSVKSSSVASRENASSAISTVDGALNVVSTQRSKLGALQNRLEHKINNLDTSAENLQAAESRIRDIDMAEEMTQYTQTSILVQAATSMLAQANSAPQSVLSLLQ
jgi:flagellin